MKLKASKRRGTKARKGLAFCAIVVVCLMPWCLDASLPSAFAGMQHLVAPGQSWDDLARKVQPGDEIILMPGRHKPATFENLQGKKGEPITIRGLDPQNRPVIQAARHGVLITNPRYIIIENIEVTGASIAGIALRTLPAPAGEIEPALNEAYVQLRNITVTKIGPSGRRDAIEILGQDRVTIEKCTFEGWGGAAIALLASANVTIDGCTFKSLPDHSQSEAILARAGTQNVEITNCSFDLIDRPALFAGGKSEPADLIPAPAVDAKTGSVYEARQIQMRLCVIQNAQIPVLMQSSDSVIVRQCTFIRPRGAMIMMDHKHEDPRFGAATRFIFGDNIVTWQQGDLQMFTLIAPNTDLRTITWETNLWWSDESPEARQKLGEFQGGYVSDQIMELDPRLDEKLVPQEPDAKFFGAKLPE